MPGRLNLTGKTFGNCKFISDVADGHNHLGYPIRRSRWLCLRCNTEFEAQSNLVRMGLTNSCGCLKRDMDHTRTLVHGQNRKGQQTRSYRTWAGMIQRCTDRNQKHYKNYGGRGITVCERWRVFAQFLADMGPGKNGWTLERVNNDGNYELGNCVYALPVQQARNKRTCRWVTVQGVTGCLKDACERYGLVYSTIRARLRRGWRVCDGL